MWGDVRKFKYGDAIITILFVGKNHCFYCFSDGSESSIETEHILNRSEPYQEPKPAMRIVAHEFDGDIIWSTVGSLNCKTRDQHHLWKRIEITKEMLFGAGGE